MPDPDPRDVLRQGTSAWNAMRGKWPKTSEDENEVLDLRGADLRNAHLSDVELTFVDLSDANLEGADLSGASMMHSFFLNANLRNTYLRSARMFGVNLRNADFRGADMGNVILRESYMDGATLEATHLARANLTETILIGANLRGAVLSEASLFRARLNETDLEGANLVRAGLDAADLTSANLSGANLRSANLHWAELKGARFTSAIVQDTVFAFNDLSEAIGLEACVHQGPSSIGMDTLRLSRGLIPESFLRGCGFADWEISLSKLHNPALSNDEVNTVLYDVFALRAQPVQVSPLFISYSHADGEFVDGLEPKLKDRGVRFWRDIHDSIAGRLESVIDRALRYHPTVLLVLSEASLTSDWVEHEVRKARELEKETGRDVLCPIALDDSWKTSRWPAPLVEQVQKYNILDFSSWRHGTQFAEMFERLMAGLRLFYGR